MGELRSPAHRVVSMSEQLPEVALGQSRNPEAWKPICAQQFEKMPGVPRIGFLLPHHRKANLFFLRAESRSSLIAAFFRGASLYQQRDAKKHESPALQPRRIPKGVLSQVLYASSFARVLSRGVGVVGLRLRIHVQRAAVLLDDSEGLPAAPVEVAVHSMAARNIFWKGGGWPRCANVFLSAVARAQADGTFS
jgi:hypothetical protein